MRLLLLMDMGECQNRQPELFPQFRQNIHIISKGYDITGLSNEGVLFL